MDLVTPAQAQTAEAIHAAAQAGDQIAGLGPIGAIFVLVSLAMTFVIVFLWRDGLSLRRQLAESNAKFGELAERAVKGLEASRGAIENATRSIEEQGRANDARQTAMSALAASSAYLKDTIDRVLLRLERSA